MRAFHEKSITRDLAQIAKGKNPEENSPLSFFLPNLWAEYENLLPGRQARTGTDPTDSTIKENGIPEGRRFRGLAKN